MKLKLAFLLALISTAGLIAADAPKPDAPKGDAPKGEGKEGKRKGPSKPDSVSDDDWKKFLAASEKAKEDPAVKAADAKLKEDPKDADARKALMEARKAAILKADASLDSVLKALEEARGKGKGKKKKDEAAK